MSEAMSGCHDLLECDLDLKLQSLKEADLISVMGQMMAPWGPSFRDYNPFRNTPFNNTFNNAFPNVFKNKP